MPNNIAGTPTWHETITAPETGETGDESRFVVPFTELKDCANYVRAIREPAVRLHHQALSSTVVSGPGVVELMGAGSGIPTITLATGKRILLFCTIANFALDAGSDQIQVNMRFIGPSPGNTTPVQKAITLASPEEPSPSFTLFESGDADAGEYQPDITLVVVGAATMTFTGNGYAQLGYLILPAGL